MSRGSQYKHPACASPPPLAEAAADASWLTFENSRGKSTQGPHTFRFHAWSTWRDLDDTIQYRVCSKCQRRRTRLTW